MSNFLSSLFGGANSNLNSDISKTGSIADFSNALGRQNTTQGSQFFSSLLSGDATKTAQALAPQISAAKTSLQQNQKTASQNGSRSGGTAASNASANDKIHSDITNLTGSLTGGAASNLLSSGQSLLGAATGGYGQEADLSQKRAENWANSIFGGLAGGLGANAGQAITGGLGKIPGLSEVL